MRARDYFNSNTTNRIRKSSTVYTTTVTVRRCVGKKAAAKGDVGARLDQDGSCHREINKMALQAPKQRPKPPARRRTTVA